MTRKTTSYTVYVGIDPGASGGLAAILPDRVVLARMPDTNQGILGWLRTQFYGRHRTCVVIEKVWGYVGGVGSPGPHMFSFGKNYGALCMALDSLDITYKEVPPATWQASLGIPPRRKGRPKKVPYIGKGGKRTYRLETGAVESKQEFKRRLRQAAVDLYPGLPGITLANCDALLIATYCEKLYAS